MKPLNIAGLTPLTTIDFPNRLAAVVFCQGCPWRCRYCQNPELLSSKSSSELSWEHVRDFLKSRQGLLDAVVFSGGEPTRQTQLSHAMREAKEMGFEIGLHSAGIYPKRLENALPFCDWVGLDIKAEEQEYAAITQVQGSGASAWESARLLINSGVAHEIRITFHQNLASPTQLEQIIQDLEALGASSIVLQACRTHSVLDHGLHNWPVADCAAYATLADTHPQISLRF